MSTLLVNENYVYDRGGPQEFRFHLRVYEGRRPIVIAGELAREPLGKLYTMTPQLYPECAQLAGREPRGILYYGQTCLERTEGRYFQMAPSPSHPQGYRVIPHTLVEMHDVTGNRRIERDGLDRNGMKTVLDRDVVLDTAAGRADVWLRAFRGAEHYVAVISEHSPRVLDADQTTRSIAQGVRQLLGRPEEPIHWYHERITGEIFPGQYRSAFYRAEMASPLLPVTRTHAPRQEIERSLFTPLQPLHAPDPRLADRQLEHSAAAPAPAQTREPRPARGQGYER